MGEVEDFVILGDMDGPLNNEPMTTAEKMIFVQFLETRPFDGFPQKSEADYSEIEKRKIVSRLTKPIGEGSRPSTQATLHCADCFNVLPAIPAQSVDLVLADLPYGTTQCAWDTEMPLKQLWHHYNRICSGPVILFAQAPFDKILGASNIKALKYEWIWEKTNATGHLNAKKAPMKAHENVLVFYTRQPTYNPIKTSGHVRKTAKKRGDGSPVYGKQNLDGLSYDSTERYPRSVIEFASDKQKSNLHPTQKPVALCEYLIRTYSNPGDTVLDNCMGSGTTGVAALSLGRKFIGIERDPEYFATAKTRIFSSKAVQPSGEGAL